MILPYRLLKAALGSLWAFRSYAALMMIGLIIGIASLTVIHEIGQGAQKMVTDRMASMGFGANAFYISAGGGKLGVRRGMKRTQTLTPEDAEAVGRLDGIDLVVPHKNVARTQVSFGRKHTNTRVRGAPPGWASARNWAVLLGRFVNLRDLVTYNRVAVLGTTVARELFGEANPVGRRVRIGRTPFTVVGVMESKGSHGWHDRDDFVIVPFTTATKRLARDDKISGMRVMLEDPGRVKEIKKEVTDLLRQRHKLASGVPDDFLIITPDELMRFITRQSRSLVAMLTFISAVSLFVSGVVIMNIMLVAVSERSYEIGVRRAVGARRRDIMLQFLAEALMLGLAGGGGGALLGLAAAWAVRHWGSLEFLMPWPAALGAALLALVISLGFGLAPARRAAGLTPVDALRE